MTPFDTQKIRADLLAELRKAEREQAAKPALETLGAISWIERKLEFLSSEAYRQRKQSQFERVPDEGLL